MLCSESPLLRIFGRKGKSTLKYGGNLNETRGVVRLDGKVRIHRNKGLHEIRILGENFKIQVYQSAGEEIGFTDFESCFRGIEIGDERCKVWS